MCRFAGWIGEPRRLSSLLYEPPRSLSTQAWDPHEMLYGHVNVDGTGVAWWPPSEAGGDPTPLRYATPAAAWNDANLPSLAPRLQGRVILAAVRSATPGIPFGPTSVAPFVRGPLALSHNGFIEGFRAGIGRRVLAKLSDEAFNSFDAVSDSLAIMLLVQDHVQAGMDLPGAVAAAIDDVREVLHGSSHGATLNLLASDGNVLVASRASVSLEHNSLYVSEDFAPGGFVVVSEPLDAVATWEKVAPESLVVADGDGIRTVELVGDR